MSIRWAGLGSFEHFIEALSLEIPCGIEQCLLILRPGTVRESRLRACWLAHGELCRGRVKGVRADWLCRGAEA